jgi:hypothetical protein
MSEPDDRFLPTGIQLRNFQQQYMQVVLGNYLYPRFEPCCRSFRQICIHTATTGHPTQPNIVMNKPSASLKWSVEVIYFCQKQPKAFILRLAAEFVIGCSGCFLCVSPSIPHLIACKQQSVINFLW